MKEVKAFIRSDKADDVIDAIKNLGVSDMTVIDVMGIGRHFTQEETGKYSVELVQRYSKVAKLEVVCRAVDAANIVDAIRATAYTGQPGDGMIYVVTVETAVKIRTGVYGGDAL